MDGSSAGAGVKTFLLQTSPQEQVLKSGPRHRRLRQEPFAPAGRGSSSRGFWAPDLAPTPPAWPQMTGSTPLSGADTLFSFCSVPLSGAAAQIGADPQMTAKSESSSVIATGDRMIHV